MTIIEKDKKYIAGTYGRFPVELVSGKGSVVYGSDGKKYIDLGSGIGVTAFGIADDVWCGAVKEQLEKLQHVSNLYYTDPCAELAEKLVEKTGMKKVFFSNSGAEANECMIKAARKWGEENKGPEFSTIVTLNNSFHGRTITTLSATGQDKFHQHFGPMTPGFVYTDAENAEMLEKVVRDNNVCAVMIECIQGEGGVVPLSSGYIKAVCSIVEKYDILLLVDEVQTGNGRTGELYSYMNFGVTPDAFSTAKGLGGGLPIGATVLGEKLENVFGPGDHGSTFGGNPVSCAGAVSIIDRIDEELLDEVRKKSAYIFEEFTGAEGVESVTGAGLMIGIRPTGKTADIIKEIMNRGVLVLSAKDKVRLLPALNIPFEELKEAAAVIKAVCAEYKDKND